MWATSAVDFCNGHRTTTYLDAAGVVFDATIPYDARFFESLARMVDSQPRLDRDRAMIDPLRTLGIEKGKAFNPDATTREVLSDAAQEARQWLLGLALPGFERL